MEIQSNKIILRKKALKKCKALSMTEKQQKDSQIFTKFQQFFQKSNFNNFFCYVNFKTEVDTLNLIEYLLSQNKIVYVPKIIPENISIIPVQIKDISELTFTNIYGIKEPDNYNYKFNEIECTITPGVAFDIKKNRIGYGKGFYDRFFKKYKKTYKVALCYDCQIVDKIQTTSNDVKVDLIITENKIF